MTIEDLKNVRRQRLRVISLQERIDRLRSGAEYPLRRLGEMSQNSDMRDKLAEDIAKIVDLERELALDVMTLEQAADTVERELMELMETRHLSGKQRNVLWLRYFAGLTWDKVAETAECSERYCYDVHKRFLEQF